MKKKTYSVSALPKADLTDDRPRGGMDRTSRRQASTHTLYEVKTIKIDRSGMRSVQTRKSIDDQPQEVRDLSNSMQMLHSIK